MPEPSKIRVYGIQKKTFKNKTKSIYFAFLE